MQLNLFIANQTELNLTNVIIWELRFQSPYKEALPLLPPLLSERHQCWTKVTSAWLKISLSASSIGLTTVECSLRRRKFAKDKMGLNLGNKSNSRNAVGWVRSSCAKRFNSSASTRWVRLTLSSLFLLI